MTALSIETSYSCSTTASEDEVKLHNSPTRVLPFIRTHDLALRGVGDCRKNNQTMSLDEGTETGAVINALVTISIEEASGESARWIAVSGTEKILRNRAKETKKGKPEKGGKLVIGPWTNATSGDEVFVWSSKCNRPGYGSQYPVVRSRGLIPASAHDVVELIMDSDRVMEYNKYSTGRKDLLILTHNTSVHSLENKCPRLGVPGEAKIFVSTSQPPLVRKPMEFKQLFYAQRLHSDNGVELDGVAYIAFGRSVWECPDGTTDGSDNSTTRCEVMLTVSLIREVTTENGEEWCELTTVTHAINPGVPLFIGKKLGLVAAEEYVKYIRAYFEKK